MVSTMGFPRAWRCALFLCVLIINHHLIAASHSYQDHVISPMNLPRMQSNFADDIPADDDDVSGSGEAKFTTRETLPAHRNSTSGLARHKGAQKRFFGLFIFIVSLVVTVVATTVTTIYDIKGCCGLGYSSLCGFEEDFRNRKQAVSTRAKIVDAGIQKALKLKDEMESLAKTINDLWKQINLVINLQKRLLKAIDPQIEDTLNIKVLRAKRKAARSTKGIDGTTVNELEQTVDTAKRNFKLFVSWTLGPGMMGMEKIVSTAYKRAKIGKIYKSLKVSHAKKLFNAAPKAKSLLGFSDDAAKGFLKATAVAKFGAKGGKALKFLKVFKGAGAILSIISIGVDVFNIVNTFVQCGKKSDKAKEAMSKVDSADSEVTKSEKQLEDFNVELSNFAQSHLMPNLRNEGLKKALKSLRDLFNGMDYTVIRTFSPVGCAVKCENYGNVLSWIQNVFHADVGLTDLTENCLKPLEYTYNCWLIKVEMIKYVLDGCREGGKSYNTLYGDAMEKFKGDAKECLNRNGTPYATRADMKRILVNAANSEGFDPNCKSNSVETRLFICDQAKNKKRRAGRIAKILKKEKNIDVEKKWVKKVIKKCNIAELSPKTISKICDEKRKEIRSNKRIAKQFDVTREQVKGLDCPGM